MYQPTNKHRSSSSNHVCDPVSTSQRLRAWGIFFIFFRYFPGAVFNIDFVDFWDPFGLPFRPISWPFHVILWYSLASRFFFNAFSMPSQCPLNALSMPWELPNARCQMRAANELVTPLFTLLAQTIAFYVFGRLWEAHSVVFYEVLRLSLIHI